jgi:putative transposase
VVPRVARFVCAGIPYHVTQRGNRRGSVFFNDYDRESYLAGLETYATRHDLAVLAYCLMANHVHLVVVPGAADSLHRVFRPLHMRHAQRVNRLKSWSGHLWQGRYFAAALDEPYLWAAVRYVELNPVAARLTARAEDYPWSSAAAHCGLRSDPVLTRLSYWQQLFRGVGDWAAWLGRGENFEQRSLLRRNTAQGLPCGSPEFLAQFSEAVGSNLHARPRGRPRKSNV